MQELALKIRHYLVIFEKFICASMLFSLMCIVSWGVIERYVLKMGTGWPDELSRYICIWAMMIGASLGVVRGAHVGVEVFVRLLPKKVQHIVEFISYIVCGIFTLSLSYVGWKYFNRLLDSMQLTPTIEFPIAYAYLAIPAGCLLMTVHYILKLMAFTADKNEDEE